MRVSGSTTIAVAMSGGVDSNVAAWLLAREGHDLVGVTLEVWPGSRCCDVGQVLAAGDMCARLGVPHLVLDVQERFGEEIVGPFCQAYLEGITPSPCPDCNRRFKFGVLLDEARERFGATAVASGHYVRVRWDRDESRWQLLRGLDRTKDQSYMLYTLTQEQLAASLFPLGEMTKARVRALAERAGLPSSRAKDSQDVCFALPDLRTFLRERLGGAMARGPIVDMEGRVLGEHQGLPLYTVGQRKGLGDLRRPGGSDPEPMFVVALRPETNELVVGPRHATSSLEAWCPEFHWVGLGPREVLDCQVQIRYRARPADATLFKRGPGCRILFREPQPSVTPGQAAVAYLGDLVVGGGTIGRREACA